MSFLSVILFESAIKFFFPQGSFYLVDFDRTNNVRKNKIILKNPENSTTYRSVFPFPYFTNSRGEMYSEKVYSYEKKKKDLRILLVGGSNMIPFREDVYERALGKTVELINCSMVASNYLSYYQNLRTNCSLYKEVDIVVFQINLFPQNDLMNGILSLFYGEYISDNPDYYIYSKLNNIEFPHGKNIDLGNTMSFPISNEYLVGYKNHHFVNKDSLYEKSQIVRFFKNTSILIGFKSQLEKLSKLKMNITPRLEKSLFITKEIRGWFPQSRIIMIAQSNLSVKALKGHEKYWELWNEFRQKTTPYKLEYIEAYRLVKQNDLIDYSRHYSIELYKKILNNLVHTILSK